jgi:hypothetical protein
MNNAVEPERRAALAMGLLLLVFGIVALIAQVTDVHLSEDAWPYTIIVPGLVLLVVGLVAGGGPGTGLTIAGTIVTTVGGVLLYQATTDDWASWAYAWALVGPTAAGVGLLLSGLVSRDRDMVRRGTDMALVGLTLFAVGYVFFVGIIGLDGREPTIGTTWIMPALLVVVGVIVIARALWSGRREDGSRESTAAGPGTPDRR